jgi:hypothetical protein
MKKYSLIQNRTSSKLHHMLFCADLIQNEVALEFLKAIQEQQLLRKLSD